jgi:hypothetical protein
VRLIVTRQYGFFGWVGHSVPKGDARWSTLKTEWGLTRKGVLKKFGCRDGEYQGDVQGNLREIMWRLTATPEEWGQYVGLSFGEGLATANSVAMRKLELIWNNRLSVVDGRDKVL